MSASAASARSKYECPSAMSLNERMTSRMVTRAMLCYDSEALEFDSEFEPQYFYGQMHYAVTGATGLESDENHVPAKHFNLSTMICPAGAKGPLHIHTDAEEVFFAMRRRVRLIAELNEETWEMETGVRDPISWPVEVCRGVIHIGDEEALMCVMVGRTKPGTPTYPPNHPVSKVKH